MGAPVRPAGPTGQSLVTTTGSPSEVAGSFGTDLSGGAVSNPKAPVRSPATDRRQRVRFGTLTPV